MKPHASLYRTLHWPGPKASKNLHYFLRSTLGQHPLGLPKDLLVGVVIVLGVAAGQCHLFDLDFKAGARFVLGRRESPIVAGRVAPVRLETPSVGGRLKETEQHEEHEDRSDADAGHRQDDLTHRQVVRLRGVVVGEPRYAASVFVRALARGRRVTIAAVSVQVRMAARQAHEPLWVKTQARHTTKALLLVWTHARGTAGITLFALSVGRKVLVRETRDAGLPREEGRHAAGSAVHWAGACALGAHGVARQALSPCRSVSEVSSVGTRQSVTVPLVQGFPRCARQARRLRPIGARRARPVARQAALDALRRIFKEAQWTVLYAGPSMEEEVVEAARALGRRLPRAVHAVFVALDAHPVSVAVVAQQTLADAVSLL